MSDIPIRSFTLKQQLQTSSVLRYQLVQSETKSGLWQICIKDIAIIFYSDVNLIAYIESNLVKDLKYNNASGGLQSYHPKICSFALKGKVNEKKLIQLEKNWFQVNAPNSDLKLYIRDVESDDLIIVNCELVVTVLMQRIK
jgi:hypothetical protein